MRHPWMLVLLAACGESASATGPPGRLVASSAARAVEPAPAADVDRALDDTLGFALDVYRRIVAAGAENVAFAPWSVVTALSMTYPGARGATREAFEATLHLSLPADRYHRAMNTVDLALEARGHVVLRSENQIFTQLGMPVEADFLAVLAREYGAGVRQLDFAAEPERARAAINGWIASATEQLIPELLPAGSITVATRLTLVNTLYFKGAWKMPFRRDGTAAADFTLADGSTTRVAMMLGEALPISYGRSGDIDVLDLPYEGDELSLAILVPPVGKLGELEASLDAARFRALLAAATPRTVKLKLPRFEARTQARLDEVLAALGLGIAFSDEADFSGMTAAQRLAISAVLHEAVVRTDEVGTEAAAATAVIVAGGSLPERVEVNRPFLFALRDRPTGAVLFLGRIGRPLAP